MGSGGREERERVSRKSILSTRVYGRLLLHKIQTLPSIVKREERDKELNVYMCQKK